MDNQERLTPAYSHNPVAAVELRDLDKLGDVLGRAIKHHRLRDEMNAELHLASQVRYSPLTSELEAVQELVVRYQNGAL